MDPFKEIDSIIDHLLNFNADNIIKMINDGTIKEYEKEMHIKADLLEENTAILKNTLRYTGRR